MKRDRLHSLRKCIRPVCGTSRSLAMMGYAHGRPNKLVQPSTAAFLLRLGPYRHRLFAITPRAADLGVAVRASGGDRHGRPILFLTCQHCPTDPDDLVSQRDDRDILVCSCFQLVEPRSKAMLAFHMHARRPSTVNEKPAKVAVAPLGYAEQLRLSAGRVLSWDKPEPGREVTPPFKAGTVGNGRDERCGH